MSLRFRASTSRQIGHCPITGSDSIYQLAAIPDNSQSSVVSSLIQLESRISICITVISIKRATTPPSQPPGQQVSVQTSILHGQV